MSSGDDLDRMLDEFYQMNPEFKKKDPTIRIEVLYDMRTHDHENDNHCVIEIKGPGKFRVKMEFIRNSLKRFYDTQVKRTFSLFPI